MFNFFANLALAVYYGSWVSYSNTEIVTRFINYFKVIPIFNLFNNSVDVFYNTTTNPISGATSQIPDLAIFISVILSTICCIGVFFIIVKAIKKLFTCFLDF